MDCVHVRIGFSLYINENLRQCDLRDSLPSALCNRNCEFESPHCVMADFFVLKETRQMCM